MCDPSDSEKLNDLGTRLERTTRLGTTYWEGLFTWREALDASRSSDILEEVI
jgi:hypothetical protein